MSITSKIESLITAANSVTGESRTDLTAAVQDLKDGYGGGGLPAEYEAVEYISASGGQLLKISYEIQSTDIMRMKAKINYNAAWKVFAGIAGINPQFYLQTYTSSNLIYLSVAGSSNTNSFDYSIVNDIVIEAKNIIINGGVKLSGGNDNTNFSSPFGIFGTAGNDNAQGSGDVYYLVIIGNDGTKKVNLIPCYRKSDKVIGMYDLVSGTFYTNAGTGSFTCYPAPPTP